MSILSNITKALKKAPIKRVEGATPKLTQFFEDASNSIDYDVGHIKNAEISANVKPIRDKQRKFWESVGEIPQADLNDVDYGNFDNTVINGLQSELKTDIASGGIFKSGSLIENSVAEGFENAVKSIEKESVSVMSSEGFADKFIGAVKKNVEGKKKAIGLSGDSPYKKMYDEVFEGKESEKLDDLLNLDDQRKVLEDIKAGPDAEKLLSNDGTGPGDGFIQRIGKKFYHRDPDNLAISQISGNHAAIINEAMSGAAIKLTPDQSRIISLRAAQREIDFLRNEVISPYVAKNPSFGNSLYRNKTTINDFTKKLDSMSARIDEMVESSKKYSDVRAKVKIHDGKDVGSVKSLFFMKKMDGGIGPSDELLHFWNSDIPLFSTIFSAHGRKYIPPAGIELPLVERTMNQLSKAAYTEKVLNGKVLKPKELAEKYGKRFPEHFSLLDNEQVVDYIDSIAGRSFNDDFFGKVEELVDSRIYSVFTESDAVKYLVGDFSVPKDVLGKIDAKIKRTNKGYVKSPYGFVKERVNTLDLSDDFFFDVYRNGIGKVDESMLSETDKVIKANSEKLIADNKFLDGFLSEHDKLPAAFSQFWRGTGANTNIGVIGKIRNHINQRNALIGQGMIEYKKMTLTSYDPKLIGGLHKDSIVGSPRMQKIWSAMKAIEKKNHELLKKSGYFEEGADLQYASRVNRDTKGMITEGEFRKVEQIFTEKFNATGPRDILRNRMKEAVDATMKELDPSMKNQLKFLSLLDDIVDPMGALSRKIMNQTVALSTMEMMKGMKAAGSISFVPKVGFSKLTKNDVNLTLFSDMFGTKNIYLHNADMMEIKGLLKDYTLHASQSLTDLAFESNNFLVRSARGALLNVPSTWVASQVGNAITAFSALGLSPVQWIRASKKARKSLDILDERALQFLSSGVASVDTTVSALAKKGGKRAAESNLSKGFLQKANPLNPDSDITNILLHHFLEKPDMEFRYVVWDALDRAGKSTDEIIKVIERTIGTPNVAPSIIKKMATIPGGDIFAAFTYTMMTNMFRNVFNNPKAYFKTMLAMLAIQQASVAMFLDKQQRENLRMGKDWLRPSIFNTLRLDPSMGLPGGNYMAASWMSNYSTDVPFFGDSAHPLATANRVILGGQPLQQGLRDSMKSFKKTSQLSEAASRGDIIGAVGSAGGVVIRDLGE